MDEYEVPVVPEPLADVQIPTHEELIKSLAILATNAKAVHNRVKIITVTLIVEVLLTLGLLFSIYQINDNSHRISKAASYVTVCEASNLSANRQHALWTELFKKFPNPNRDPKMLSEFIDIVDRAYPQLDCDNPPKDATP